MPIQPINRNDYSRIPDDEDVTPVDRSLSKNSARREKGVRCVVIVGVVLLAIAVVGFFGYHIAAKRSSNMVSIYSSTKASLLSSPAKGFNPTLTMKLLEEITCITAADSPESECVSDVSSSEARLVIDSRRQFQKILGFGGAFTESAAINFYALPEEVQERVLELYFGATGIGLTLGRVHINSCDFSLSSYNFDVVENDYDLIYFDQEVTHDTQDMIPFILDAMAISKLPIRLVASPWSPPPWMKLADPITGNRSMTGSVTPNGLRNEPRVKLAWARYLSKFITAYKEKGIDIWALTPQNEPEFPAPWEACSYNASFERDFIREYLGPVVKTEHPEVLLLAFDHNKDHLKTWTETILGGGEGLSAAEYVDGMAFHWYGGEDRLTDGTYGYNNLNASYHLFPDKIFLATEGCSCPGVDLGNWMRAERLGHDIIFDLLNYAQGWIDWNLIVDSLGGPNHLKNYCDASIITTELFDEIVLQPKFAVFGHFSRYLVPDSIRVQSSIIGNYKFEGSDSNVQPTLELGAFACEHSVRQMWSIHPTEHYLYLTTPSLYEGRRLTLCVAHGDGNRKYLRLADCSVSSNDQKKDQLVRLTSSSTTSSDRLEEVETRRCFSLADQVLESGALIELTDCSSSPSSSSSSQRFHLNVSTGEVQILSDASLCLTAGWPFLTAISAVTPEGRTVSVVMNEATVSTSLSLWWMWRGISGSASL